MDKSVREIVDGWLKFDWSSTAAPERDAYWCYVLTVMNWNSTQPERVWEFIMLAYKRELSDGAFANLAAGPLEDLLSSHGEAFVDRVVEEAKVDDKFNKLLGGVWKNDMSDEVWNAISKVRNNVW